MADDEAPRPSPAKRPTPWSVLVAAAVVFAIGLWLYLGVRDEVRQNEDAKARAKEVSSAERPKLLGRDIIPQDAPAPSPGESASAGATGSASPGPLVAPPNADPSAAAPAPSSSAVAE